MVIQLSKFSEHLADKTKTIRDLLQKENQWIWGREQQKAFEQIKSGLTQAPVLALCDPGREARVTADAPSFGLGGVLLAAGLIGVASDVSHRSRICADRRGGLGVRLGVPTILGVQGGKIDLCGDRPWTPGAAPECSHTSSGNPGISNATDGIPLGGIGHVPGGRMCLADALSGLQTRNQTVGSAIGDNEVEH